MRLWALQNACSCARDHLGDHVSFHLSAEAREPLTDDLSEAFRATSEVDVTARNWTPTGQPELVTLDYAPGWLKPSARELRGAVGDPTLHLFLATAGRKFAVYRTNVTLTEVRFRLKYTPHAPPVHSYRLPGQVQGTVRLTFAHGALFRRDRALGPGYHLPRLPDDKGPLPVPWYGSQRSNWGTTLYLGQLVVL